jgi:predicted acetyltransferase
VDPAHGRKGFARRLIEPGLARADEEGRACFLETSEPRNVGLYERFGFRVVSSYVHDEVESFCLRRPPAGADADRSTPPVNGLPFSHQVTTPSFTVIRR